MALGWWAESRIPIQDILPAPLSNMPAAQSQSGTVLDVLPKPESVFVVVEQPEGVVVCVLPRPATSLVGAQTQAGTVSSMLPKPIAAVAGAKTVNFAAVGAGTAGSGTSISFTDTIPAGVGGTLVWVSHSSTVANPTVSAQIGSTSATLVSTIQAGTQSGNPSYLSCFAVLNPPTGSQTVSFSTSSGNCIMAIDTVHYAGVTSIGTPITMALQSGQPSMSVSSTNANYMYANAFSYTRSATGQTFSAYNQTQRWLNAAEEPIVAGDAPGNGGTLTFSATRSNTTNNWGGIIVPLNA